MDLIVISARDPAEVDDVIEPGVVENLLAVVPVEADEFIHRLSRGQPEGDNAPGRGAGDKIGLANQLWNVVLDFLEHRQRHKTADAPTIERKYAIHSSLISFPAEKQSDSPLQVTRYF